MNYLPLYSFDPFQNYNALAVLDSILFQPRFGRRDPAVYPDKQFHDDLYRVIMNRIHEPGEDRLKALFETEGIFHSDYPFCFDDFFVLQAARNSALPLPDPFTIYTVPSDILPACRNFLDHKTDSDSLLASFGFTFQPDTLGVYFKDGQEIDAFLTFLASYTAGIKAKIADSEYSLLQSIQKLQKQNDEPVSGIFVRSYPEQGNGGGSFQNILMSALQAYIKHANPDACGLLPFRLNQLCLCKSLTLINLDAHVHKSEYEISQCWQEVLSLLEYPCSPLSQQEILTFQEVVAEEEHEQMRMELDRQSHGQENVRRSKAIFGDAFPVPAFFIHRIQKAMQRMAAVNRSRNVFRHISKSFQKPNRRQPDNPDRKGFKRRKFFLPDLHIYADTSGSISEEDYLSSCRIIIEIARKLNVDLYFNSFSDCISDVSLISIKNKSVPQALKQIETIEKVCGGTDYSQVWHYIGKNKKRMQELSILITDFEYNPPAHFPNMPKNILYIPCALADWDYQKSCAEDFVENMIHLDPNIDRKICM